MIVKMALLNKCIHVSVKQIEFINKRTLNRKFVAVFVAQKFVLNYFSLLHSGERVGTTRDTASDCS